MKTMYFDSLEYPEFCTFEVNFESPADEDAFLDFLYSSLGSNQEYEKESSLYDENDRDGLTIEEFIGTYEKWKTDKIAEIRQNYRYKIIEFMESINLFAHSINGIYPKYRVREIEKHFTYTLKGQSVDGYVKVKSGGVDEVTLSFKQMFSSEFLNEILTRREAEQLAGLTSVAFQYHLRQNNIKPDKEVGKGKGRTQLFWRSSIEKFKKTYVR